MEISDDMAMEIVRLLDKIDGKDATKIKDFINKSMNEVLKNYGLSARHRKVLKVVLGLQYDIKYKFDHKYLFGRGVTDCYHILAVIDGKLDLNKSDFIDVDIDIYNINKSETYGIKDLSVTYRGDDLYRLYKASVLMDDKINRIVVMKSDKVLIMIGKYLYLCAPTGNKYDPMYVIEIVTEPYGSD